MCNINYHNNLVLNIEIKLTKIHDSSANIAFNQNIENTTVVIKKNIS